MMYNVEDSLSNALSPLTKAAATIGKTRFR